RRPAKLVAKAIAEIAPRSLASNVWVVPLASERSTGTMFAAVAIGPAQTTNPHEVDAPQMSLAKGAAQAAPAPGVAAAAVGASVVPAMVAPLTAAGIWDQSSAV